MITAITFSEHRHEWLVDDTTDLVYCGWCLLRKCDNAECVTALDNPDAVFCDLHGKETA